MKITSKLIRERLREKMIDPELNMNVVDLGLIYDIRVLPRITPIRRLPSRTQSRRSMGVPHARHPDSYAVSILMTLTTPGCPLAAVFMPMMRQALSDIPGFNPYKDLDVEVTFDPPWHQGMMSERAKAEMGFEP